jgi:hypothetical protein
MTAHPPPPPASPLLLVVVRSPTRRTRIDNLTQVVAPNDRACCFFKYGFLTVRTIFCAMMQEYEEMMVVDEVLNEQANVVIFYNGRKYNLLLVRVLVLGRHQVMDLATKNTWKPTVLPHTRKSCPKFLRITDKSKVEHAYKLVQKLR